MTDALLFAGVAVFVGFFGSVGLGSAIGAGACFIAALISFFCAFIEDDTDKIIKSCWGALGYLIGSVACLVVLWVVWQVFPRLWVVFWGEL